MSRGSEESAGGTTVTAAAAAGDATLVNIGSESGVDESRCGLVAGGGPTTTTVTSVFPSSSDFSSFSSLSASSPTDNNNISNNNNCMTAASGPLPPSASCNTSAPASGQQQTGSAVGKKYMRKSSLAPGSGTNQPAAAVKKRGRGRARKNVAMEQELQILRSGVTGVMAEHESVVGVTMPTDCPSEDPTGVHCGPILYSDFNSFSNLSSSSGSFAGSTASMSKKYMGPGSPSQMGNQGCGGGGGGGHNGGSGRTKRMRTSFKHHQLKKMKSYFTMNHNPDSKALKELSIETGLSKRVLQVSPYIPTRFLPPRPRSPFEPSLCLLVHGSL